MADDYAQEMIKKYGAEESDAPEKPSYAQEMVKKYGNPDDNMSTAEDAARSVGSGVLKGTGDMLDQANNLTPMGMIQNTINWGAWGANKLWPDKVKPLSEESKHTLVPDMRKEMSRLTYGAPEYEPKTTAGRYSKTVGEFIPAALPFTPKGGLLYKAGNLVKNAIIPAIASEAASDTAKATGHEEYAPYARLAAGILSPLAAERLGRGLAGIPGSVAGANPERLKNAQTLEDAGIPVTAGQMIGNSKLVKSEGKTHAGAVISSEQNPLMTKKLMESLGSDAEIATTETLAAAQNDIYGRLSSIADSTSPIAQVDDLKIFHDAIKSYTGAASNTGTKIPGNINDTARQIIAAFKSGTPIPGSTLRQWRTDFGRLGSASTDPHTATLYKSFVEGIDNMVSKSLKTSGREEDWNKLELARQQYRDYLAIEKAAKGADNGILSPQAIYSALHSQGPRAMVQGKRGDIGDVAHAAKNVLSKIPVAERTPNRIAQALSSLVTTGGLTSVAWYAGLSPLMLAALTGAGVVLPKALHLASDAAHNSVMWPSVQRALKEEAALPNGYTATANKLLKSTAITGTAIGDEGLDRIGRKTGGRIGYNHEAVADKLVLAAERAKKAINQGTEALLSTPDDAVAHALEIANRSI